jgi:hypothetical protein
MRRNYWSCSVFADGIRGTPKPSAGTGRKWQEWEQQAKSAHPVRYWIAEEALDAVQNFIWWPVDRLYDIKYYINNRWVSRTHSLTAHPRDIKPGQWRDVGDRFLPCLFNELVDFVEVELAWWHIAWSDQDERKKYHAPFWATGWFRWRTWRCPQAGLDNLQWQMSLTNDSSWGLQPGDERYGEPTAQANNAKEILALYTWWTEVYHQRPDPHHASGWTAYCNMKRERGDHILDMESHTPEEAEMSRTALDKSQEIEQAYHSEDEEMMMRLIRIRQSLWT